MIKIMHTEPFQPLGPAIPKPAPAAPQSREIKPGIWQAPDGKLFTDLPEGSMSSTPVPFHTPTETPLPVVPNALGDGWIAWGGGECPIPDVKAGGYEIRWRQQGVDASRWSRLLDAAELAGWQEGSVAAYRLIP
jgi:hypothetical protein